MNRLTADSSTTDLRTAAPLPDEEWEILQKPLGFSAVNFKAMKFSMQSLLPPPPR